MSDPNQMLQRAQMGQTASNAMSAAAARKQELQQSLRLQEIERLAVELRTKPKPKMPSVWVIGSNG